MQANYNIPSFKNGTVNEYQIDSIFATIRNKNEQNFINKSLS